MKIDRRSFIKVAAAGGAMAAVGDTTLAHKVSGRVLADGKPISGVVVSDGLNCVETGDDGVWSLPENEKVRFIFVTVPSGWRTDRRYLKYEGPRNNYDFSLVAWGASKHGSFSFVHIGDSEIKPSRLSDERKWVAKARDVAALMRCRIVPLDVRYEEFRNSLGARSQRILTYDDVHPTAESGKFTADVILQSWGMI